MSSQPAPKKLVTRRNFLWCVIATVGYIVAYILLQGHTGLPGALALIPVLLSGWLLGQRWGFIASAVVALITVGLVVMVGGGWLRVQETSLGLIVIVFSGGLVGWFREVYERTRAQAQALRQAQAELSRFNAELEARVHSRTEEIRALNASLELRVAQRTEELTLANAQLDAFNNMVAHDLRAPLSLLQTFNDILVLQYSDKPLDAEGREMLQGMQDATQRMKTLIQDLFDFSRLKDEELHNETVDLSAMAGEVVEALKQGEPSRPITLQIATGLSAQGDARYLRILLDNLIGNAWKYSAKNPQACIEVGQTTVNGQASFFVRDNGIGFSMDHAQKLFQPFQRYTSEFAGTGLGLATCKRIIDRHGGRIWAGSKIGEGTTIYFELATQPAKLTGS